MFSRKDKNNDSAANPNFVTEAIRNVDQRDRAAKESSAANAAEAREALARDYEKAAKPQRPHEIPPRAFVGTTLKQLNTVSDNYHLELAMIDKDIAKLQEERRQLVIVLDGVKLALDSINKSDSTVSVTSKILSPEERIKFAKMSGASASAAKPPADFDETALRDDVERALIDDATHK